MPDHNHDPFLLLRALVDELARCGVRQVCTSPGSRSTPLVTALTADRRLECLSHIDERGAGFFAVGAARESGLPVVLACTSGTAAANYLPAITEAREARLGLIVLTADRPPELRDVGAGQTIDQIKLYGDAVRWFQEIDTEFASPERLRWIRQLACRAVTEASAGPVHLNFQLREPLVAGEALPAEVGGGGRPGGEPWTASTQPTADPTPVAGWLAGRRRGVIVAGESRGLDAAALGTALGWPVLADPLSGARHGAASICHYDLSLRCEAPRPGAVLRVGRLPTSKALRAWLNTLDCPQALVVPDDSWPDPGSDCDARFVTASLSSPPGETAPDGWLESWRAEDDRVADVIAGVLGDELSEPAIARLSVSAAPAESRLVVAASMPIRDVEAFAPRSTLRVHANRGANGIDGTVSTAYGVAAASGAPTTLLIGDVALAHDAGGLLAGLRLGIPLTIVLVDNGGGGIFDFLPVSGIGEAYETHVATPPRIDFAALAAAYGASHHEVASVSELARQLSAPAQRTRILHCRTDRADNVALHRRIAAAVG